MSESGVGTGRANKGEATKCPLICMCTGQGHWTTMDFGTLTASRARVSPRLENVQESLRIGAGRV